MAPHLDMNPTHFHVDPGSVQDLCRIIMDAPITADRQKDLWNVKLPRTANFNPDVVDQFSSMRSVLETDKATTKRSFLSEAII